MGFFKQMGKAIAKQQKANAKAKAAEARERAAAAKKAEAKQAAMDKVAADPPTAYLLSAEPKRLTEAALAKAIARIEEVAGEDYAETLGGKRAHLRKVANASKPILGHAIWMQEQGLPDAENEMWADVESACGTAFEDLEEALTADDADDVDADGATDELTFALDEALAAK